MTLRQIEEIKIDELHHPKTNYDIKKELIRDELKKIKERKLKQYNRYKKLKSFNITSKTIINLLNAVSVSSIIVSYSYLPFSTIIALSSTAISSLLSVLLSSYEMDNKITVHHTTSLQLSDLYRTINLRILRNNLSSDDLDEIILDVNDRLALIEDYQLPA